MPSSAGASQLLVRASTDTSLTPASMRACLRQLGFCFLLTTHSALHRVRHRPTGVTHFSKRGLTRGPYSRRPSAPTVHTAPLAAASPPQAHKSHHDGSPRALTGPYWSSMRSTSCGTAYPSMALWSCATCDPSAGNLGGGGLGPHLDAVVAALLGLGAAADAGNVEEGRRRGARRKGVPCDGQQGVSQARGGRSRPSMSHRWCWTIPGPARRG